MSEILLEMKNISKQFAGVKANDNISFNLKAGEIHALVGENGAGKTTLMKILYGLYKSDSGKMIISGKEVNIKNPKDAINHKIGMVHQHFMLVDCFTILENIIIGEECFVKNQSASKLFPHTTESKDFINILKIFYKNLKHLIGIIDTSDSIKYITEIMEKNKLYLDLDQKIEEISVGLQQRVEIVKTLFRGVDVLIFDEPTAVLTPQEVIELFKTFKKLTEQGKGIVFISHKLDEVLEISDRITVIRHGKVIKTLKKDEANKQLVAELMVGKPVKLKQDIPVFNPGEVVLSTNNLTYENSDKRKLLDNININVREGEIYGIAGVEGNGQSELLKLLSGEEIPAKGKILLNNNDITKYPVRKKIDIGISHIPEDRHKSAVFLPFALCDNLMLGRHHKSPYVNRFQFLKTKIIKKNAQANIKNFDIRTPSEIKPIYALSGGNQQKAVVAREITSDPVLLIAAQPTRGVDIGAIEFIHKKLLDERDKKKAIILISADLEEILSLSDRIGVMYKGKIIKEFERKEATKEKVGFYMTGEKNEN